jgi:uncharacterized protein YifN (PemK superfamily)
MRVCGGADVFLSYNKTLRTSFFPQKVCYLVAPFITKISLNRFASQL